LRPSCLRMSTQPLRGEVVKLRALLQQLDASSCRTESNFSRRQSAAKAAFNFSPACPTVHPAQESMTAPGSSESAQAVDNVCTFAHAALEVGVTWPLLAVPSKAGSSAIPFRSHALRFAVRLAEHLQRLDQPRQLSTKTGCYASLDVLFELVPLMGPLAPMLSKVHDALQLCLLSEPRHSEQVDAAGASPPGGASDECAPHGPPLSGASRERAHVRVPYFVLMRDLEEAAAALQLARDSVREGLSRSVTDIANLDEQLATAKAQLKVKTATIETLMRELGATESELKYARKATQHEEHKFDVLQSECATMAREFLASTTGLEEDLDRLRTQAAAREEDAEAPT